MCSLWRDLSDDTINFELETLTMTFDLHLKNFNSEHKFLTIRHSAFIRRVYSFHQDLSGVNISLNTWPWLWPLTYFRKILTWHLIFTVRDRAIIFDTCSIFNKTFVYWNTWPFTSIFKYVSYWRNHWKQPSCFMPHALIKATYNGYSGISQFNDSLSSLSNEIQYRWATNLVEDVAILLSFKLCRLHLPKARVESCSAATTLASYVKNFPGWPTLFCLRWGRPIKEDAYNVTYILTSWMIKICMLSTFLTSTESVAEWLRRLTSDLRIVSSSPDRDSFFSVCKRLNKMFKISKN